MSERGLPGVRAREVAERAGVSPALVGYYFGGKNGLLRAVVEEIAREGKARTLEQTALGADFRSQMQGLIAGMIQGFFEDPYAPRLLFEQVFFAGDVAIDRCVAFSKSTCWASA